MKLGKKDKEKELMKAKKLIEEAEAINKQKEEQAKPTPIVTSTPKAVEATEPTEVNEEPVPKPSKKEVEELKQSVDYYTKNYRGLFNPNDNPIQTINPMDAEIANLLFGILQELRMIRQG